MPYANIPNQQKLATVMKPQLYLTHRRMITLPNLFTKVDDPPKETECTSTCLNGCFLSEKLLRQMLSEAWDNNKSNSSEKLAPPLRNKRHSSELRHSVETTWRIWRNAIAHVLVVAFWLCLWFSSWRFLSSLLRLLLRLCTALRYCSLREFNR